MKPALDNAKVGSYELFTKMNKTDWHVRFLNKNDKPMQTNILYIAKECYETTPYNRPNEYINLIGPMTAWGAKRIVNKFLKGQTPAKKDPKTIKRHRVKI